MKKILTLALALTLSIGTADARMRFITDTEIEHVVGQLVAPLADAAGISGDRLRIRIVADDEFNAFVMAGEDIFINTGLIAQIENPLAFQAVIAHELGHVIAGHIAQLSEKMRTEMMRSAIVSALGVGMMAMGGNASAGIGVVAGSQQIARGSILAYTRDEERMADAHAVDLMIRAGLCPHGMVMILRQMNEDSFAREAFANPYRMRHPFTSERLHTVRELLRERNIRACTRPHPLQNEYDLIRAKIIGYMAPADRVRTIFPPANTTSPAIYARAIMNMRIGNLTAAETGMRTLISRQPNNPFFFELLGDVMYRYGRFDDSVRAYERALELRPQSPQIQIALAIVLSERRSYGDADRAAELARRALIVRRSALAYWTLSRAEAARGNDGISTWAMAEHYNMRGNRTRARELARRAQRSLPRNSPEWIRAGELL